ncbi:MAG: SulP family inorganic anion transporter, partial [Gammaproteobacteria bacterium]|nr:SulP family inorganic anion transporter [Gammaproteobacteria bacterium]
GDIFGGLTAGIIALPLALAFGEASGAGPIAGIWGAIFVGFFASLFGGTGTNVSGPTGPMVVVFAAVFASLSGSLALIFAAVVLAGILQILLGVFKMGQYVRLVPYPVVSGFMSGIGVIIIALQLSRLFGHEPDGGGTIPALAAIPGALADPNIAAVQIGLLTLLVIFTWPAKWGKFVPGPLAALLIGTTASLFLSGAPLLGDIPTGFPSFVMPEFTASTFAIVLEAAILLAVLGAIDSLLTSLVADNMTRTRHDSDKELIGQGIGNTVAGLFGAIPGAGATMRTVVNIKAGGQTKLSGMIHSALLIAIVISLGPLAAKIPHAVLAGILIKVGYDIIDFAYLKRSHRGPRLDLILMAMVLLMTVFVDLITAVAAGVVLAALGFIKQLADQQLKQFSGEDTSTLVTTEEENALLDRVAGKVTIFDFGGPLSFGAAADVGHQVRERVKGKTRAIILDFSKVPFIDVSAARAVETVIRDSHDMGKLVYETGMNDAVRNTLVSLNSLHGLSVDVSYQTRVEALRAAVDLIESEASANELRATS